MKIKFNLKDLVIPALLAAAGAIYSGYVEEKTIREEVNKRIDDIQGIVKEADYKEAD